MSGVSFNQDLSRPEPNPNSPPLNFLDHGGPETLDRQGQKTGLTSFPLGGDTSNDNPNPAMPVAAAP